MPKVAHQLVAQRRIEPLEQIGLHQIGVVDVEIDARVEDIGVDVRAGDDDGFTGDDHDVTCAGLTISPATAVAAATKALPR
jgi:hypothetical protein